MTSTPLKNEALMSKQASMQLKFRRKRFGHFLSLLENATPYEGNSIRILDIGGTESYWKMVNFSPNQKIEITLLNLNKVPVTLENFESIVGNALDLSQFKDKEFDIVFSNSVIEHVGEFENQKIMAKEFRRVAKNYYIQTPNYHFFFEPHFRLPLIHFLPKFLRTEIIFRVRQKSKNKEKARKKVNGITLLSVREMKNLFPEGILYREKFYGMTKSITMFNFVK